MSSNIDTTNITGSKRTSTGASKSPGKSPGKSTTSPVRGRVATPSTPGFNLFKQQQKSDNKKILVKQIKEKWDEMSSEGKQQLEDRANQSGNQQDLSSSTGLQSFSSTVQPFEKAEETVAEKSEEKADQADSSVQPTTETSRQPPTNLHQSSTDSGETEGESSINPEAASKDKSTVAVGTGDLLTSKQPKAKQQKIAHSSSDRETSKHYGDDSKHSNVQSGTRIHIPVSMEG